MIEKLYWLPAGKLSSDYSALNLNVPPGQMVTIPIWVFLLVTEDGPILLDTGMPESFINNPDYFKGTPYEGRIIPLMERDDHIVSVLKKVGYSPSDMIAVINSHLHMDHAGGNPYFPDTPIYIQQKEWEIVKQGISAYAPPECLLPNLNYTIVEGDTEPFPGLQLLSTPGHSPGHQSVLVTTKKTGPILLTVDMAYTRSNYEEGAPFFTYDYRQARQSIERIKQKMEGIQPSIIFFGHDIDQGAVQQVYPIFY
ncbi:quorum-quenching N-acyl homoserine lactonase AiiA [Paenibacillus arenosi]|uniref:quorum-quenching N-acyl-homoserine lactonase n=1 Tax=Paenibacillus arenosi TaxID=2774142 RepID=A0ABR9AZS3_9BACL|nr:N-acyl homoserine lactonase family protein [Paenibacillus arenosi]MBD8499578.1 N-acyl homoserine lactonase family protein [Paenibacillus arenosi]